MEKGTNNDLPLFNFLDKLKENNQGDSGRHNLQPSGFSLHDMAADMDAIFYTPRPTSDQFPTNSKES